MNSQSFGKALAFTLAIIACAGCSPAKETKITVWSPEHNPEIRRLLKERRDVAEQVYQAELVQVRAGMSTPTSLLDSAVQLNIAETDLAETPEQLIKAREKMVELTKKHEADSIKSFNVGRLSIQEVKRAQFRRLSAEIDLLRTKRDFQNATQ